MAELNILVYKYKTKVYQTGDCKWQLAREWSCPAAGRAERGGTQQRWELRKYVSLYEQYLSV